MNKLSRSGKQYCRQVKSLLPCKRRTKNIIMEQITDSILSYVVQNPNADFSQLEQEYGKPQEVAAAYIANEDMSQVLTTIQNRRRVLLSVIAALLICMTVWIAALIWIANDAHNVTNGYVVVEID